MSSALRKGGTGQHTIIVMRDGHRGVGDEKVLLHINVAIDFLAIAFLCSGRDQLRTMTIGDSASMTKPRLISSYYMQHGIEWVICYSWSRTVLLGNESSE